MPPLHIQNKNHELNRPLLLRKSNFTFQWASHGTFFTSIAWNSTISFNIQGQEHNNLTTILGEKLKGAHERSKSFQFVKPKIQMQTLTLMNKVVIEDYCHMTIISEIANWMKLTHLLSKISLNLRAPFCTFTFISKKFIAFLNVHTFSLLRVKVIWVLHVQYFSSSSL